MPVFPGRYWVDANGYGGFEGGPPLWNIRQFAYAAGGNQGGAWSYHSKYGGSVGGDGSGFMFYQDKDTTYFVG
jgi:hypothetical protein